MLIIFAGFRLVTLLFHLLTGQNVVLVNPRSLASFAACELDAPVPHVNTT